MQTQTQTPAAVQEITPVSDRVKYERGDVLVRIEVDCRVLCQALPGGYIVSQGKQSLKIARRDLPAVLALVEPEPQEIEAARKRFNVELDRYIADNLAGLTDPDQTAQRRRALEAQFPNSVEGIFHRDMGRSILPLVSVTVLEDGLPAPIDEAQIEQHGLLAGIVAREVAKVIAQMSQQQKKQ